MRSTRVCAHISLSFHWPMFPATVSAMNETHFTFSIPSSASLNGVRGNWRKWRYSHISELMQTTVVCRTHSKFTEVSYSLQSSNEAPSVWTVAVHACYYACCRSISFSVLITNLQEDLDWLIKGSQLRQYSLLNTGYLKSDMYYSRPPLWSSGQSSWLQIRRPGFDSRHYQKKK
jgi:hypothetical protein